MEARGWDAVRAVQPGVPAYWTFGGAAAVKYLALFAPAFVVSTGLLQKIFGAQDDRAVRIGVGLNALGLLLFAGVPTLLGIMARARFPDIAPTSNLALPMIFMHGLPPLAGAVALAAVFALRARLMSSGELVALGRSAGGESALTRLQSRLVILLAIQALLLLIR